MRYKSGKRFFFPPVLFFLLIILGAKNFLSASSPVLNLSMGESRALHREMVEMDLAMRNLSSGMSMGYYRVLLNNLQYLSNLRTLENYRHRDNMLTTIEKMKDRNVYVHIETIQLEAKQLFLFIDKNGKSKSATYWQRVNEGYGKISDQCRACHEKTLPYQ